MRIGAISQSIDGALHAGGWQLVKDFEIPAASADEKLIIMGDSFADSSQNGRTVTAAGITGLATDQWKFPELSKSIYFDGSGDYLYCADSADWAFGTDDFTIDFWLRFYALPASGSDAVFWGQFVDNNNYIYSSFQNHPSLGYRLVLNAASASSTVVSSIQSWSPTIGEWYHIALVRSGNDFKFYVNGVQQGSTVTDSDSLPDYASTFKIGSLTGTADFLNGYINGFRVVKDALWTSGFTPPVYADYGGNRTYHTFRGLDGNTDEEYRLIIRQVGGVASSWNNVFINDDVGSNYGYQYISGYSTNAQGGRNTYGALVGSRSTFNADELALFDYQIKAKSGTIRTAICKSAVGISGATVTEVNNVGLVWNNSTDNLTLIQISGGINLGLGVGTHIFLFKRNLLGSEASSGIQTGTLVPLGGVSIGQMELVGRLEVKSFVNILTGGTPSADSNAGAGFEANKANDGNLTTQWKSGTSTLSHWWEYDLGSGNEVEVRKLRIRTWKDGGGGGLKTFSLQCTNDHSTWYNVGSWVAEDLDGVWQYFESQVPLGTYGAFRYWLVVTQDNYRADNYAGFYEVEMGEEDSGTGPLSSYLFSGLDGDADILYEIKSRVVSGTANNNNVSGWWNSDESTENASGYQYLYGSNTTIGAGRNAASTGAWIQFGYHTGLGEQSMFDSLVYAKSGLGRITISERIEEIATVTITSLYQQTHIWDDVSQNITELLINSASEGLGVGTVIELWALRRK